MKPIFLLSASVLFFASNVVAQTTRKAEELRRFPAVEARQGVTVDKQFFYAIDNHDIGKYRKENGERVGGWTQEKGGRLIHLNAGTIHDGKLYAAHSNFPQTPVTSSVEIWDTETMKHVGSHSFGIFEGSLTWVDYHDGHWYACFAKYAANSDTGVGPAFTQIIRFDNEWRRVAGWIFPADLVKRFGRYSSSGGAFGRDGLLFISGHDAKELYVLALPEAGSELIWKETIAMSAEGQAFDWDTENVDTLYSIQRKTKEVIVSTIKKSAP